jgi:hypothetical protein
MQIGSGLPSFAPQQNATSSDSAQQNGRSGAVGGVAQGIERSRATAPTQDAAVTISAQGAAAAARERAAAESDRSPVGAADAAGKSSGSGGSGVSGGSGQLGGGAMSNASARDASQASGSTKPGAGDASAAKPSASTSASKASPVKSFAYGTLGLERPDKPKDDSNKAYTAGRWLAAGATLWGLLALILA